MRTTNFLLPLLAVFAFLTSSNFATAQTVVTMNTNSQTVTGCDFVLYDDGGPNGGYSDDLDRTITICSPNGEQIRLDIAMLDIERAFDDFIIYDGNSTAADEMFNSSDFGQDYNPQIIVSSGSCITIRLDADFTNSDPERGFEIFATCFTPNCDITTPAGNTCAEATPICSNEEYCGSTNANYTDDSPGNLESSFCGSIENNSFLKFTAAGPNAVFEVAVWGCTGSSNGSRQGVQFQVYSSSDCNTFTTAGSCFSPGVEQGGYFTATGLTYGDEYYIMIDGFAGDNCNYTIKAISGVQLPANAGPDQVVCGPSVVQMSGTVNPPTSTGYYWIPVGDGNFDNVNDLNTRYNPGPNDIANGSTQVVLYNPAATSCLDIKSDTMTIVFKDVELEITPNDPKICKGNSVTLVATATPAIPTTSNGKRENTNSYTIPDDGVATNFNGTTGNYGSSPLEIDCLNPEDWTLDEYCINSSHSWDNDLEGFYLVNPCGNIVQITGDNNLVNGCFTPGTSAAWITLLNCSNPNGTWEVRAGDSFGGDEGSITYFSLTFSSNNYQWSPATNLNTTTGNTVIANPPTTTTYTVKVLDCEAGCSLIQDVTVEVSDMLLTGAPTNVSCKGANNGSINITATGGIAPYEYSKDGGTNYQPSSVFSGLSPGSYTITVRDAAGCIKTFSQVISEPSQLVLNATVASNCVFGNTGEINASGNGGTTPYLFSIDGTTFQSSGNFTGLAPGNYTVTLKDNSGCIQTKNLVIGETPNANFTIDDPACDSYTTQLTTTPTVGTGDLSGSGVGLITFDGGTPISGSVPGETHGVNSNGSFGTFTITYTVTNGSCSATVAKDVTFTEEPDADFSFTTPACGDVSAIIDVIDPVGTISWTISPNDGSTINPTGNPNEYQFNANAFTSYSLTLNLNNAPCTDATTKTITFQDIPNPQINPTPDVCGLSTNLTTTITPGNIVNWRSIPSAGVTFGNSGSANTSVNVTLYGTYDFIISESGACTTTNDTVTLTFFESPSGFAGNDTSVCDIIGHKLNGEVYVGTGFWSTGVGINDPSSLTSNINPGSVGTFTYTLSVSNGVCPVFTDNVNVTIDEKPIVNFNPDEFEVCGLDAPLNGISTVGTSTWSSELPATIDDPSAVNTNATNDAYGLNKFYFSVVNGSCPAVNDSIEITFEQAPVATAIPDTSVCGKEIDLSATYTLPGNDGFWTGSGVFTPSSNVNNPKATVSNYGTYTFTWTENGSSICPADAKDIVVNFLEQPDANAGNDQEICGTTTLLDAIASSGNGLWTYVPIAPANAPVTIVDPTDPNTAISIDTTGIGEAGFGKYKFYWTESVGTSCAPDADSVIVYFIPNRSPDVGLDLDVCGDTAFIAASNVYESGTWNVIGPGSIIMTDNTQPSTIASLDPANFVYGKYRFIWVENFSPCTPNNRDTLFVEYFEPPVVDAGLSPDQICGLDAQLNALTTVGTGKWTWQPVAPTVGTITFANGNDSISNPPISASDYGTYNLYWDVENGTCAPPNDSIEFTFYEKPTPTATGPADVCSTDPNQTFHLTGVSSSGTLWTWNGPAGVTFNPDENTPEVDATVSAFGTYTFIFNEINHPVCGVVKDSLTVQVLEQPEVDAGTDASACGASYQLDASITVGQGTGTWSIITQDPVGSTISFSDINDPNSLVTISPAPVAPGEYVILRYTVQSGSSCSPVFDEVRVDFNPSSFVIDAGPDSTICGSFDYAFQATALNVGENGTWSLDNGPAGAGAPIFSNVASNTSDVTVDTYGKYTFKWSVTNSGCPTPAIDLVTIDFRLSPTPYAGEDDTICGLDFNISATTPLERIQGFWSYVDDGSGSTASINDIFSPSTSASVSGPGAYGIQQFVWNEFNGTEGICADTLRDTVEVLLYQAPMPNGLSIKPVCGTTGVLLADTSIALDYLDDYSSYWEYLPSNGATPTYNPSNQVAKPTVTMDKFGTYNFVWHESNGICPDATDTVDFIFVPPSKPQAGLDVDSCSLSAVIKAVPSFGQGEWVLEDLAPHSFENPFSPQTVLTVSNYGNYKVIWREESSPCPANQDTLTVQFNEAPSALAIAPTDVCGPLGVLMTQPSIISPNYNGTWSSSPNVILSDINNDTTGANLNTVYGEYSVLYTERNGAVCPEDFETAKINYIEEPVAAAGIDSVICGKTITLYATPSVGVGSWRIDAARSAGTGSFSQPSNPNSKVTANAYGVYTFIWKETNFGKYNLNCENEDTLVVEFLQQPNVIAPADFSVCSNEATLNAPSSVPGSTRVWSYNGGSGLVAVTPSNPGFASVGTDYGVHTFTVTENNGKCVSTDDVNVEFVEQPTANTIADYDTCGFKGILRADAHIGSGKWIFIGTGTVNITSPNSTVSNVTVSQFGAHSFVWQVENKTPCSIARDTLIVNFVQIPDADAPTDFSVCGDVANLNATPSVGTGTWRNHDPDVVSFGNVNNASTTVSLIAPNPASYHTYKFSWTEDNLGKCSSSDTVLVTFVEQPEVVAQPDNSICGLQDTITATIGTGAIRWQYLGNSLNFNGFSDPFNDTTAVSVKNYGQHRFRVIQNNGGTCPEDSSIVTLSFYENPTPYAGLDDSICGFNYELQAVASRGIGTWSKISGPGVVNFADASDPNSSVDVSAEGEYEFMWSETNGICGPFTDTMKVFFEEQPIANAGSDITICDIQVFLGATPTRFGGEWSLLSGPDIVNANYSNTTDPNALFAGNEYGIYTMVWTEQNKTKCAISTDTLVVKLVQEPNAVTDGDLAACSDTIILNGKRSVGNSFWKQISGPGQVMYTDSSEGETKSWVKDFAYGTYRLAWIEDNGGACPISSDTIEVKYVEQPIVDAGLDAEFCGLSGFFNGYANAGGLSWTLESGPGNAILYNTQGLNSAVEVDAYGTYTFKLRSNNEALCTDEDFVDITFIEQPTAYAGPDVFTCGLTQELGAVMSTGTGGSWITSNINPGSFNFVDVTDPLTDVTVSNYGIYHFVWSEFNSDSCAIAYDTVAVEFNEQPIVDLRLDTTVCGDSAILGIAPIAGTGVWSSPNPEITFGPDATADTVIAYASAFGTYEIVYTSTNKAPCVPASDSRMVTFIDKPIVSIVAPDTVCNGSDFIVEFTFTGVSPFEVDINFDGQYQTLTGLNSGDTYTFLNAQNTGPVTVTRVSDGSAASCPLLASVSEYVEVIDLPTATISGNEVICYGDSAFAQVFLSGIAPFDVTYSTTDLRTYTSLDTTYGKDYFADEIVTITAISDKYCVGNGIGQFDVTVNDLPDGNFTISGPSQVCEGDPVNLVFNATQGQPVFDVGYVLNAQPDTTFISNKSSGDIIPIVGVVGNNTIGLVTITDDNMPRCSQTFNVGLNFTVNPKPQVTITSPADICEGTAFVIDFVFTGVSQFDFEITNNGTTSLVENVNSNYSHTLYPTKDETYVIGNIFDGSTTTCSTVLDQAVNVHVVPLPVVTTSIDVDEVCYGEPMEYTINVVGEAPFDITYDVGNGNETILGSSGSEIVTVSGANSTQFVVVSISDASGLNCPIVNDAPIDVIVNPIPVVDFSTPIDNGCKPFTTVIQPNLGNGESGGVYTWSTSNGDTTSTEAPTFTFLNSGSYDVDLAYTSLAGCSNSISKTAYITVHEDPVADFTYLPTQPTVTNNNIHFTNASVDGDTYFWTFGADSEFGTSVEENPLFIAPNDDQYNIEVCLDVYSINGCRDTVCDNIKISGDVLVYVPNTFTPNGDNINDLLFLSAQGVSYFKIEIFNRWGKVIFQTEDPTNYWNGEFKGETVQEGVYPFIVYYKDKYSVDVQKLRGHINIIR